MNIKISNVSTIINAILIITFRLITTYMFKSNKVFNIATIIDALIIITFMPIRACVGRTARPGFLRLLPPKYRPGPDCFKVLMAAMTMMVMMVVETK